MMIIREIATDPANKLAPRLAAREILADRNVRTLACINGLPSAGKSTLAARIRDEGLAQVLGMDVEPEGVAVLDAFLWGADLLRGTVLEIQRMGRIPVMLVVHASVQACYQRERAKAQGFSLDRLRRMEGLMAASPEQLQREGWAAVFTFQGEPAGKRKAG